MQNSRKRIVLIFLIVGNKFGFLAKKGKKK